MIKHFNSIFDIWCLSVRVYGEGLTCGAFVSPESAASGAISEVSSLIQQNIGKYVYFKGISGDPETFLLLKALLTKTDVFDISGIHDQRSFTLSAWPRLNLKL